jgi:hypothetical protein
MKRARAAAAIAASLSVTAGALAQRLDPRVPQTLIVGSPAGATPTVRGDAARRGRAPHLPASPRVAWRKELGQSTPISPLVRANGDAIVFTAKGELVEIDRTGSERSRVRLSSDAPSSASLLSDDAVLVATVHREIVLVRNGAVVAHARVGRERDATASASASAGERSDAERANVTSVLPLDDGGAVIAFDDDVLAVDRDAHVRARARLPAPLRGVLVAGRHEVLATLATGSIAAWTPGGEVRRLGRFSAPVIGPALQPSPGSLVAVVEGPSLMRFDLARATTTLLIGPPPSPAAGAGLGTPSSTFTLSASRPTSAPSGSDAGASGASGAGGASGPSGSSLVLMASAGGRTTLIDLDDEGRERRRVQVALAITADAGPSPIALGDVLVDPQGRVAFVSPEGVAGVVDRDGTVRTLGESVCSKGRHATGLAPPIGLVASSRGFLVACDNGVVLSVEE